MKRKFSPLAESPTPDVLEKVKAALKRGEKITAIKLYMSPTGVGLSEAKEIVEEIQRRNNER